MIAIIVAIVIVVAGVGVWQLTKDTGGEDTYKIAVVKHNFEPLFIAEELGYFEDEGVKVELVSVSSGNDSAQALASGNVQLAGFGSDPFFNLIDSYGDRYQYIGRWMMDEGLKGAAAADTTYAFDGTSLAGAEIGVNTQVSYFSLLLKYLAQTGQDYVVNPDAPAADKVNIYHYPNSTISGALTDGEVDMIIAGATNINVVESNPGLYRYVEATEEYRGLMSVGMFADKDFVDAHEGDIAKILKAIDRACTYMSTNLEDSKRICMEKLEITNGAVMEKYITLAEWGVKFTQDDVTSLQESFRYIVEYDSDKYSGTLAGKATVDITPYLDYRFVSQ